MHKRKRDAIKAFHKLFKFYSTLFIIQKEKRSIKLFRTPISKISPLGQCHTHCWWSEIFIAIRVRNVCETIEGEIKQFFLYINIICVLAFC